MIRFEDCTVTKGETVYYEPGWGVFDLALGLDVRTVYSGPGDRKAYGEYDIGFASTYPGRVSPFSAEEKFVFSLYEKIRLLRESPESSQNTLKSLDDIAGQLFASDFSSGDWLLYMELIELAHLKAR